MATGNFIKFYNAIIDLNIQLSSNEKLDIRRDKTTVITIAFLSFICSKYKEDYCEFKNTYDGDKDSFNCAVKFLQDFNKIKLKDYTKYTLAYFLNDFLDYDFSSFEIIPSLVTERYILSFDSLVQTPYDYIGAIGTPSPVCQVASDILQINENDNVAEFCGGICNFSSVVLKRYSPNSITAFEQDEELAFVANIISEVYRIETNKEDCSKVEKGDVLEKKLEGKYSKIFCDLPANQKVQLDTNVKKKLVEDFYDENDEYAFSEIIFIMKIIESLQEDGEACVLILTHLLTSASYAKFVNYLVDNKCIRGVMQFGSIYPYPKTNMAFSLLVLSKPNTNSSITMMDTKNDFYSGGVFPRLSSKDASNISKYYLDANESKYKKVVDYSFLETFKISINQEDVQTYNILPYAYFIEKKERDSSVIEKKFTEIFSIYRGLNIPITKMKGVSDLIDVGKEDENTCYYLNQSAITPTKIIDDFPILNIEVKNDTALVQSGDLLICSTKTGKGLKVGYVKDIKDINNKKVYISSNLYIARKETSDEELYVNPLYIKAFLEKEDTYKYLNSINPGIKLYLKSLDNLSIPLPDKKTQDDIAKKYESAINNINECEKQLEDAKNNLDSLLNDI